MQNLDVSSKTACKDLSIEKSNELSFSTHCAKITRIAHFRRRHLQHSLNCVDRGFLPLQFCMYIRPFVEHNSIVWSPHLLRDINLVQNVPRKFTKTLRGLSNFSYKERLQLFGLDSLEVRLFISDTVFIYKMINGLADIDCSSFSTFNYMQTRDHNFKFNVQRCRVNSRHYFFLYRVKSHMEQFVLEHSELQNSEKV